MFWESDTRNHATNPHQHHEMPYQLSSSARCLPQSSLLAYPRAAILCLALPSESSSDPCYGYRPFRRDETLQDPARPCKTM